MNADSTHEARTRRLSDILASERPEPGPPFACPYLSGRKARYVTLLPASVFPGLYHSLMDLNFRRTGPFFYRPQCDECAECRMLRVPVESFRPSRSQKRALARNGDLTVETGPPVPTEEKHALYKRYLEARHDGKMASSWHELVGLYESPLETVEMAYRLDGRLVGVGIADVEPLAMSAVYFYFDPEEKRRALGVFNVLSLIEACRRTRRPHLYLGYHVPGSRKMGYKASYLPCDLLVGHDTWTRVTTALEPKPGPPDSLRTS